MKKIINEIFCGFFQIYVLFWKYCHRYYLCFSSDLDDFRVSETGISDFCKYELTENILSGIGFFLITM
mgnify:CR=1 FL=1